MESETWIKDFDRREYLNTLELISAKNLNTVCVEANCPNRYECFANKTATFLILGDTCTRNCRYCNVKKGTPEKVDSDEPKRIAEAVKKLDLKYVVITCVSRDDLEDGGANQFINTIKEIRNINDCKIEVLISDLNGNLKALKDITNQTPNVLNHNIEVVRDLFPKLRPKGDYNLSLKILKQAKQFNPEIKTKSGLMIGLGETYEQIINTLKDLRQVNCDILTIGQYLQPSENHAPVIKYYTNPEFEELKQIALQLGFKHVESGKLVRSSYHAEVQIN